VHIASRSRSRTRFGWPRPAREARERRHDPAGGDLADGVVPTRSASSPSSNSARAERDLGPRFDLRRFHDVVLADGSLPLDVLGAEVRRFIAAELAAPDRPATPPAGHP